MIFSGGDLFAALKLLLNVGPNLPEGCYLSGHEEDGAAVRLIPFFAPTSEKDSTRHFHERIFGKHSKLYGW